MPLPITSRRASERAMYFASIVLRVFIDYIIDFHKMGQLTYIITKPVRDLVDRGSRKDNKVHEPAQSASTYHSSTFDFLGQRVSPLSQVSNR